MPEALVRSGRWLRWVSSSGQVVEERAIDLRPERAAELLAGGLDGIPPPVAEWVRHRAGNSNVVASDESLKRWLDGRGVRSIEAGLPERRALRAVAFRPDRDERALLIHYARRRLERAMQEPEATLTALAREQQRVERVLRRETNAADSWISEGTSALSDYAKIASGTRAQLERHLRDLTAALETQAVKVAPNLSALVGPVVAAQLVAAAGGLEPLSRWDASRIQLLGARRRFGPGRSPRFGIVYHAEGMSQVPPNRTGALARSVAALAAVAARADGSTRRVISHELVRRRDRRIAELRRRRS